MAKSLYLSIALAFAAMASLSWAAPHWDRYSLRTAERDIPNTYPDNRASMPPLAPAGQYSGVDQENARRQASSRLSPEEKRNLRRQINEAGHDIYIPRR
jgi:hypothetical protein